MARGNKNKFDHPPGSITFPFQDIVRSELEAAIQMFVTHQNLVAAHLLTHAAHELMRANAKSRGIRLDADIHSLLREVAPKHAKDAIDAFQWAYNGIKHFKSEVDGNITFHPKYVELEIWLCIGDYTSLFKGLTDIMQIYFRWYLASKSDGDDWLPNVSELFPSAALKLPLSQKLKEAKAMVAGLNAFNEEFRGAEQESFPL